jgi:hypothetical protein
MENYDEYLKVFKQIKTTVGFKKYYYKKTVKELNNMNADINDILLTRREPDEICGKIMTYGDYYNDAFNVNSYDDIDFVIGPNYILCFDTEIDIVKDKIEHNYNNTDARLLMDEYDEIFKEYKRHMPAREYLYKKMKATQPDDCKFRRCGHLPYLCNLNFDRTLIKECIIHAHISLALMAKLLRFAVNIGIEFKKRTKADVKKYFDLQMEAGEFGRKIGLK